MTHPNRLLHRRDVEAGLMDNNPYPADLKPEELELGKAIDMLTKPVLNEAEGESVYGKDRTLRYPSFSLHGKQGNITIDRDGTYRLVGCTITNLIYECPATVILINCRVNLVSGNATGNADKASPQIRLIAINSALGWLQDAQNFYLSLHGNTRWDGGLDNCRFGNVRLLQSKSWVAENNLRNSADIVFSASMTNGAKVQAVGDYFARRCERLRFQWHHTDLVVDADGVCFDECSDILTQHHGCTLDGGDMVSTMGTSIGIVLHSAKLKAVRWIFDDTKRPVLSALGSHITTTHLTEGGLLRGCTGQRVHLGNKTQCKTGSVLTGKDGVLSLSQAEVSAASALIDATDSKLCLANAKLSSSANGVAVALKGSTIQSKESDLSGSTAGRGFDLTDSLVEFEGGEIYSGAGALQLTGCTTTLKRVDFSSQGTGSDVHADGGSLTVEGGSTTQTLSAAKCSHVKLSNVSVGKDLVLTDVAATELYGSTIAAKLKVTGGHYQSGGNTVGSTGNIDVGFGTLGGDTFGGVLTVKGVIMVGSVQAADVVNTGFMLLEGGSGSSQLPTNNRGWHVTGSMDWAIDDNLWVSVGTNTDWKIGENLSYNVGTAVSTEAGESISEKAGSVIAMTAPQILEND